MPNNPSIFNDVLSPITPGPSSSNTCGPHRIASLCRQLLDEPPRSLTIQMCRTGGYPDTFYSMQSDLAFIAGLLGKDLLSYDLLRAYTDAEAADLQLSFQFVDDLPEQPSELARLIVTSRTRQLDVIGVSLGGGEIEITEINGQKVLLDGKRHCTAVFYRDGRITVTSQEAAPPRPSDSCDQTDILWQSTVSPVFPFSQPLKKESEIPFSTAAEMLQYASDSGLPLWKLALLYESAVTGADEKALFDYAERIYDLSLVSMERGREEGIHFEGVTDAKAPLYQQALEEGRLIPLGAADYGCLDAMAIMEYSNSHGTIVCMPTGGASGIIPAAIRHVGTALGRSKEDLIRALLTAGLIGVFYYPTHYTGALGCQAEIGIAISMAAAGLVSLLDEDAATIEKAASLGGQSVMGMICNPVEGYVQVPCILRNMAAVPTAITCANAAIAGLDSLIPLDNVTELMLNVGQRLRPCNQAGCYYRK